MLHKLIRCSMTQKLPPSFFPLKALQELYILIGTILHELLEVSETMLTDLICTPTRLKLPRQKNYPLLSRTSRMTPMTLMSNTYFLHNYIIYKWYIYIYCLFKCTTADWRCIELRNNNIDHNQATMPYVPMYIAGSTVSIAHTGLPHDLCGQHGTS